MRDVCACSRLNTNGIGPGGEKPRCFRERFHDCRIYPPTKRAWWRMSSAMTYSFWGLGILALGGIVLATMVW
jgi:hypothetical protein